MAESDWNMQSNIKGKPGSQGTLFQPASKALLNPQQRWPQGYTPERLNEIRQGFAGTPIVHPDRMEDDHEPGDYREMMGYRERTVRALAKSTVPVEHLQGLKEIHGEPDENDHGTYWPSQRKIGIDMSQPGADRTLIHEIGHHYENDGTTSHGSMRARTAISQAAEKQAWKDKGEYAARPTHSGVLMAENAVQAGVHEALADNYMTEHYRTGGRKSSPVTEGQYERNFAPNQRESQYPGYNDVRPPQPPLLQGAQFQGQGRLLSVTAGNNLRLSPEAVTSQRKQAAHDDANRWAVGQ